MQGETLKVLKALEAVLGQLRKFLVDHSVLPLFEKRVSSVSLKVHSGIDCSVGELIVALPFSTEQYNSLTRTPSRALG